MLETIDALIPQLMDKHDVTGVSVALIDNAHIVYSGAFGKHENQPMTTETVISAQSLTKPIVAYAALQMIADGELELDTPLREYLETPYLPTDPYADEITPRHVLSHTCGFPNWRHWQPTIAPLKTMFKPGTDYHYSGEGYAYLQMIMEKITGQGLEDIMNPFLAEFGMNDSYLATYTDEEYEKAPFSFFPNARTNAAFSLMTHVIDYSKFIIAMMQAEYTLIVDKMLQAEHRVAGKDNLHWGLGWGLEKTPTTTYFWQWGAGDIERHLAIGSVETKKGAVILTNTATGLELCQAVFSQIDPDIGTWIEWQRSKPR